MSRIPASAGIALAGLLPVCATALGLGEVQSRSYLNQPFQAEIPILAESQGELDGLTVTLASTETFDQFGLPRPSFLSDLAFDVVSAGGRPLVRITSQAPIVEPFVTLLLEVRWPQGRLLREYTVLLDPPAFTGSAVRPPVDAPASAPSPAAATPPAPAARPAAPAQPGTHRVTRSETLWGIADRYRPEPGTDINQMMLAIYRANPDAFAGNINRLNAGATLRIPDATEVAAIGRGAAQDEVSRQTREWQQAAPEETAARLELVPPAEPVPQQRAPAAPATAAPGAATGDDESQRLLAVKDAELQALRQRVAELEQAVGGDVAVEEDVPATAPESEPAAVPAEPVAEDVVPEDTAGAAGDEAVEEPQRKPARTRPEAEESGGIVDTLMGLLGSIWLWVTAAAVIVGALLVSRRRAGSDEAPEWKPTPRRGGEGVTGAAATSDIVVEETRRSSSTGGFERKPAARTDDELPLERTISTDGPVNLDQSDPLAEADFHMAYGLYDQAADILGAAISREPGRRDLQMKLMDVLFVWENRDGFLKEARALRERIGNDQDQDWKRVLIMGKQLCPNEELFAGATGASVADMDLALTADGGGTVDLPMVDAGEAGLDFDLGEEADASAPTQVSERPWSTAKTQEVPTLESPGIDTASTMETPTIESRTYAGTTMETPTIEAPLAERTLESPTLESRTQDGSQTSRLPVGAFADDRADQTAEIDLEDLGLDLGGLDDAAADIATGLQKSLSDDDVAVDFDLSEAEAADDDGAPGLDSIVKAMGREGTVPEDTAEQFVLGDGGDTRSGPGLDLDLGDAGGSADLTSTGLRTLRRPEDPTMTEVGTKLDLARAYVDMGDPDGARSILNEVLEEGDPDQRQEARHLLDLLKG